MPKGKVTLSRPTHLMEAAEDFGRSIMFLISPAE
jgi:hypothetical protein